MSASEKKPHVRRPPFVLNASFASQWSVVLPTVYRYEDEEWVTDFFRYGRLRLSTFAKFSTYPDEARGDTQEGHAVSFGISDTQTVAVAHRQGMSAFVLSTSATLDRNLLQVFSRDSVFAIQNTIGFAHEVARQIPGFKFGIEGQCIYRPKSIIQREFSIDVEKYKREDGMIDMSMMFDASQALGGPELLLLKRKRYENQREYRLLWEVDATNGEHMDVTCPKAVQYCRRVEQTEFDDAIEITAEV